MRPKIYMIGVTHSSKKDGERILKYAEDLRPEVLFIEKFRTGLSKIGAKKWALIFLKNPLFMFGIIVYLMILEICAAIGKIRLGEFGLADSVYAKKASTKLGIPIHRIDDDVYEMTTNRHVRWTPISWMILALLLILVVRLPILDSLPILFLSFLSYLLMFSVIFGISTRNNHMMARIESVIKSAAYQKAFLVTGRGHIRDFKERLSVKFDVENLTGR